VAFAVTGVVALLSFLLPPAWQSTGVGLCLVGATYLLVLRGDAERSGTTGSGSAARSSPCRSSARLCLALWSSLRWTFACAVLFFPAFWVGLRRLVEPGARLRLAAAARHRPRAHADPRHRGAGGDVLPRLRADRARRCLPLPLSLLGASSAPGCCSAAWCSRSATLRPTLTRHGSPCSFPRSCSAGCARAREGVGASIFFHAACNLFSAYLTEGYYPHY
jgi:hypothetical protein